MNKVGVIQKSRFGYQVTGEGGVQQYFDPFGGEQQKRLSEDGSARTGMQAAQAVKVQPYLQEQLASRGQFPDESAYEGTMDARDVAQIEAKHRRETQRLQELQESLQPKNVQERYQQEAARRYLSQKQNDDRLSTMTAAGKANRAGKVGVLGRRIGQGLAGFLGAVRGLTSMAEAGASGQEFFSGLGGSAVQGAGTYAQSEKPLADAFGQAGATAGAASVRPVAVKPPTVETPKAGGSTSQSVGVTSSPTPEGPRPPMTDAQKQREIERMQGALRYNNPQNLPGFTRRIEQLQTELNTPQPSALEQLFTQRTQQTAAPTPQIAAPTPQTAAPTPPDHPNQTQLPDFVGVTSTQQKDAEEAFTPEEPTGGTPEGSVTPEEMKQATTAFTGADGQVEDQSMAGQSQTKKQPTLYDFEEDKQ